MLNRFLEYALTKENVFLVTVSQVCGEGAATKERRTALPPQTAHGAVGRRRHVPGIACEEALHTYAPPSLCPLHRRSWTG